MEIEPDVLPSSDAVDAIKRVNRSSEQRPNRTVLDLNEALPRLTSTKWRIDGPASDEGTKSPLQQESRISSVPRS